MARDGYEPIAGSAINGKRSILVKTVAILLGVVLAFRYIPFLNGKLWKASCGLGIKISGYDTLETEKYHLWFNEDSTMHLAQSGTFTGPEQMTEYVDFTKSVYFDKYESLDSATQFIEASSDQCIVQVAVQNLAKVKAEYSKTGQSECAVTTVGFKLQYTVGLFGFGFNIKRMDLFYPEKFLQLLFNDLIGGPATTDYICDTVLKGNCGDVYEKNGLDEESCKAQYEALPGVDDYGSLDDKAKGCRILHSAFAEVNKKHCPHMSFIPIQDYTGELWCQESGGVRAEDLWSDDELDFISKFAEDSGFDPETLSGPCPK